MKEKKNLIRFALSQDGTLMMDCKGTMEGRGAYLCKDNACFKKAVKRNAFNKAFSCEIKNEQLQNIQKYLEEQQDKMDDGGKS